MPQTQPENFCPKCGKPQRLRLCEAAPDLLTACKCAEAYLRARGEALLTADMLAAAIDIAEGR